MPDLPSAPAVVPTPVPAAADTGTRAAPSAGQDLLAARRAALVAQALRWAPQDGLHQPAAWPALRLFRSDTLTGTVCGVYEPCVALILQGSKQVVVGEQRLVYDSGRYLLASLDMPALATMLEASPDRPYLALVLQLDLGDVAALVAAQPAPEAEGLADDSRWALATGRVNLPLLDAFGRLLDLLDTPQHLATLAPLVHREIHYRLLTGEVGARLRQFALAGSRGQQVARAVGQLRRRYAEPLRVDMLAREACMSVSAFHHHFKRITAMSPLQYQKMLRLTEARRLMLTEHLDAATAAYRVGYESPSQFSREYSRQFGAPPRRDMAGLRPLAAQAPATAMGV